MIQHELQPCTSGVLAHYIITGIFTGLNLLLTTYLTIRARLKDVKENDKDSRKRLGLPDY